MLQKGLSKGWKQHGNLLPNTASPHMFPKELKLSTEQALCYDKPKKNNK